MIVIITTVTTVYSLKKIHPMSELLCANIEALSTGEDDGYIRNEHGCIIWPAITCFGIVVTPEGSFAADFPDSRVPILYNNTFRHSFSSPKSYTVSRVMPFKK